MKKTKLMLGDNIESLKKLPDNSVDSVVTDPPYGLSFMNKKWDYDVPSVEFWKEVYRVLKPGGHVLSFGGTRTYHRMVVNIEDAGFEIRDQIQWIYGSGFPKSHNIGKAVDKLEGNEREVVGENPNSRPNTHLGNKKDDITYSPIGYKVAPYTPLTKGQSEWEGWGSALKPANEPICLARKPLSEKSIAENVLKWGTGGINIDGCRVGSEVIKQQQYDRTPEHGGQYGNHSQRVSNGIVTETEGRFPANLILECICDEVIKGEKGEIKKTNRNRSSMKDNGYGFGEKVEATDNYNDKGDTHTDPNCPCRLLDEQSGESNSQKRTNFKKDNTIWQENTGETNTMSGGFTDKGGASRFFYQAKVSKAERNIGLDGFEDKEKDRGGIDSPAYIPSPEGRFPANIILDETAAELLDEQSGYLKSGEVKPHHKKNKTANGYQGSCYGKFQNEDTTLKGYGDGGGASRFFYVAKVSKKERNLGLDGFEDKIIEGRDEGQDERNVAYKKRPTATKNTHPTLKPINLMTYLCRLVTPEGGIVLDPFMGSGSTGIAAQLEEFRFVGMEMDSEYFKIAEARIDSYEKYKKFKK